MIALLLLRSAHDELRRRGIPDCGVVTSFPEPWSIFLPEVPARLVLIPVVSASQNRAPFVPDDLLRVQEPDSEQTVQHLPREYRGMPDVHDLEARQQRKRLRP